MPICPCRMPENSMCRICRQRCGASGASAFWARRGTCWRPPGAAHVSSGWPPHESGPPVAHGVRFIPHRSPWDHGINDRPAELPWSPAGCRSLWSEADSQNSLGCPDPWKYTNGDGFEIGWSRANTKTSNIKLIKTNLSMVYTLGSGHSSKW